MRKLLILSMLWLAGCTASVNEGQENQATTGDVQMAEIESSVEVLEDSFLNAAQKPSCNPQNSLRLVVSQNNKTPLYCLDQTQLQSTLNLGALCSGGVTITAITADPQWRPCEELKICGTTATEVIELISRGPARIRQFHFANLPWGCVGKILVSPNSGTPDPEGLKNIDISTVPPACPMCVAAGGPSCSACADDTTPPKITEVAVDASICNKVKFAIFAEDGETDLHPIPYSFDGGVTWSASPEKEFAGASASLPANRVKVRDLSGNIATFASARTGTTTSACSCRHGNQLVANGASLNVFPETLPACNVACRPGKVTCTNGVLTGDVGSFETACQATVCGCTAPGGQVIPAGESKELFKTASVGCDMQPSCNLPDNRIRVTCTDAINNVLTVVEGMGDISQFRAVTCSAQACGCRHLGVEFKPTDAPLQVFKRDRAVSPERCELTGMYGEVRCQTQGTGFRIEGDTNTTTFPYTSCVNVPQGTGGGTGLSDFEVGPGSGGGTGGGLGNDDGEGEGFRRRSSGGGGGSGCDVNKPPYFCLSYGADVKVSNTFCYLPKANGYASTNPAIIDQRISPGGFIPAYSRANATCGEKCSMFQGLIRCDAGIMSGKNAVSLFELHRELPMTMKVTISKFLPLVIFVLAACTGKVDVADLVTDQDSKAQANCVGTACAACILPWGGTLPGGQSLGSVYTESLTQCGATCEPSRHELRCQLGKLEFKKPGQTTYTPLGETKVFRSCYQRRCDCDHFGTKVDDGAVARFYKPVTITCGNACESKVLTCVGGKMKDSAATNPDPSAPTVYTSTLCNNTCLDCTLPGGAELKHGTATARYKSATAPCGTTCGSIQLSLYCNNGVLNGNTALFPATTCANPTTCQTCSTPEGTKLQNGEKYSFFKLKQVACGQSCYTNGNQVTLTCTSGQFGDKSLYPDHKYGSCESACDPTGPAGDKSVGRITGDGGGAPVWFCGLPWGSGVVSHKTQVVAFSKMKVAAGDSCANYKRLIECNGFRGLWSGGATYIYPSCKED